MCSGRCPVGGVRGRASRRCAGSDADRPCVDAAASVLGLLCWYRTDCRGGKPFFQKIRAPFLHAAGRHVFSVRVNDSHSECGSAFSGENLLGSCFTRSNFCLRKPGARMPPKPEVAGSSFQRFHKYWKSMYRRAAGRLRRRTLPSSGICTWSSLRQVNPRLGAFSLGMGVSQRSCSTRQRRLHSSK